MFYDCGIYFFPPPDFSYAIPMFVRSLRLVWLAPTKQLMLLWNVVRKQRTMAQMSTHIFSSRGHNQG